MKKNDTDKRRILCIVLFVLYIQAIFYFLVFSDTFGRGQFEERRINLEPFLEIKRFIYYRQYFTVTSFVLNVAGNVIGFMPFGFLLTVVRNKKTNFVVALLYSFTFTFLIESVQYITKLGVFDIDDLMLNTLGGILGYIIYFILSCVENRRKKS